MQERNCGRCKKLFKPSSNHKCCPKCRYGQKERKPCTVCHQKLTTYERCLQCALKARIGTGKGFKTTDGYKIISLGVDSVTGRQRRVLEHRHIMEQHLGRRLFDNENVHHKNGVRDDNRLENLELWVSWQPSGQRVEDLVSWAQDILARYKPLQ